MLMTRRDLIQYAAAVPLAARLSAQNKSLVNGVRLGVQSYSFHDIPNDGQNHAADIIQKMQAVGVSVVEIFSAHIEPTQWVPKMPTAAECPKPVQGCRPFAGGSQRNPWFWQFQRPAGKASEELVAKQRKWRETVSMDYFTGIRKQFGAAGMEVFAYNPYDLSLESSDLEIDRTFMAAKALGCTSINLSTKYTILKRLIPFAEKHQLIVAPHGHSITWDPEEFSSRKTFERVLPLSKWVGINLDIGHLTACKEDPIDFIQTHHARITNLHIKDRQKNKTADKEDGQNMPFGQGDTPIKEVLQLLKKEKYAIPALIEHEYAGASMPVEETKKSIEYCKRALA
jgi:sugar phosphate isomerase/epimerase